MKISARAKINLYLDLQGRRPDGYHELRSLMVDLELADQITLEGEGAEETGGPEVEEGTLSLDFCGQNVRFFQDRDPELAAHEPPLDLEPERWSIARALETYGSICEARGLAPQLNFSRLHLRRSIPAGAGLGGASSDAAHLLRYLLEQHAEFQTDGSPACEVSLLETLRPWLVPLGADVSFSYASGPQRASGLGEKLEPVGDALQGRPVLLVKPAVQCSTAEAFARYDCALDEGREFPATDERSFLRAYEAGDLRAMDELSCNTFCALLPEDVQGELASLQGELRKQGAPFVRMTGSGPTLCAIFDERRARDDALHALKEDERARACWLCPTTIL